MEYVSLLVCACVLWCPGIESRRRRLPDEQRLLHKLFSTYSTDVRPVFNSSHNVQITFNFNLIQVMDMDEKNQIMTLNAWLEWQWKDELIEWDPAQYGGLEVFRLPTKKLWLPDIVLYNKYKHSTVCVWDRDMDRSQ